MKNLTTEQIKESFNQIMFQYDPDNDTGNPRVTFVDVSLLLIVDTLLNRIEDLEMKVQDIEDRPSTDEY